MNIIKFIKIITFAMLICFVSSTNAFETDAEFAYLVDYESGQVLYEKNSKLRMHPSSMTKIMTAYVVFDEIKQGNILLTDLLNVSLKARSMEGSRMFLEAGTNVTVESLLMGMIVQSGNDAAIVLAEGISGSEEEFVLKMNEYAKNLGLSETNYENCTGLSSENHYTSANDLYKLSHSLIDHFPGFYTMFAAEEYTHNNITQVNRNTALGNFGTDGIKTGHTQAGGYGIVLSAEQKGRRLIAILNGLDSESIRFNESIKILDHGFNDFVQKTLVAADDIKYNQKIKVRYGSSDFVKAILQESISVYVEDGSASEFKIEIKHLDNVKAPIIYGQVLGSVVVKDSEGNEIAMEDLVADGEVKKAGVLRRMLLNVRHLLKL